MNFAIIFLVLTILGGITLGASTYGLGKNETDKDSSLYKASTAFSIIGASFLFIGLGGLAYKSFKECPRPLGYGNSYPGSSNGGGSFQDIPRSFSSPNLGPNYR